MKTTPHINCHTCTRPEECCLTGTWVDLDEAKKILTLKIKGGDFFHLKRSSDPAFPSGYKTSTSKGLTPCTFLSKAGRCIIHIKNYSFKPVICKEFPYENGRLSPHVKYICTQGKPQNKTKK